MSSTDKMVQDYLNEVDMLLGSIQDKDQIIQELRAHLWDLAHNISKQENIDVTKAFEIALSRIEKPKILADRFLSEYEDTNQKYSPENRITEKQFLIMSIIGLTFVGFISGVFTILSSESWIFWIFTLVPGITLSVGFVIYLYVKDEKQFHEEMDLFKSKIREQFSQSGKQKEATKKTEILGISIDWSFWSAFGEHFGGLLGAIVIIFSMVLFLWIEATDFLPLFNANWYTTGAAALYIGWTASLFAYIAQFFLGRIRVSRLISAAENTIVCLSLITLLLAYPFTAGQTFLVLIGSSISDPNLLAFFSNADFYIKLIFGIVAIIEIISATYDIFKFGLWQPEDKKSLL